MVNWWRSSVTSLSHWPSTSVYDTVSVRHRVARVCQRQRRHVYGNYSSKTLGVWDRRKQTHGRTDVEQFRLIQSHSDCGGIITINVKWIIVYEQCETSINQIMKWVQRRCAMSSVAAIPSDHVNPLPHDDSVLLHRRGVWALGWGQGDMGLTLQMPQIAPKREWSSRQSMTEKNSFYRGRRWLARGRDITGVCLSLCLSVYPQDISKTAAARMTKLDIKMFHHESWKPVY